MKISQNTLAVLKNFASINTNILIRQGDTLATISAGKNIFARATVEETFPRELAIYDLNSLLALLTLADDQDVEFGETSLKITKDSGEFEYFYAKPEIIVAAPDKTIAVDEHYSFDLSQADINMTLKAAAIVGAPILSITAKKGVVTLSVGDPKNTTSNSYKKKVGESDLEFNCMIDIDRFKVIPDSYKVTVNKKFIHMDNQSRPLQYWLAVNPNSSI